MKFLHITGLSFIAVALMYFVSKSDHPFLLIGLISVLAAGAWYRARTNSKNNNEIN